MKVGLTENEIDWCRANAQVDVAAEALATYRACIAGVGHPSAFAQALAALRRARPRPRLVVDRLYVYLMPGPAGEGIPGVEGPSGRTLLIGTDRASMRALAPALDVVQRASGIRCMLWRFALESVVRPVDLAGLASRNAGTGRCEEAFAFVGRAPSGDEMPMALPGPSGPEPMLHNHVDAVRRMAERLAAVPGGGTVELRRFVRREPVPNLAI